MVSVLFMAAGFAYLSDDKTDRSRPELLVDEPVDQRGEEIVRGR